MFSRRVLVLGPMALYASAAAADLYDDWINSSSKVSFVAFFARNDTATGHAFVGLGTELDNGLLFYEGLYGFYPASGGKRAYKALFRDVGVIDFKMEDLGPATHRFRKSISEEQKGRALEVLRKWKSDRPSYNLLALGGNNCNVLAREIANSIGFKLPSENPGTTFPANYFSRLKQLNH